MKEELVRFLNGRTKLTEESFSWGTLPVLISGYLSTTQPPMEYVSSVRAIVFRKGTVLVIKEKDGRMYILPGGRVEKDESMLQTLQRELLEETGWTVTVPHSLGFMHLHHLGPKPEGYEYPFPDFIWPIYVAEAVDFMPERIIPDDYAFESFFQRLEEIERLPIDKGQLLFLKAALGVR